MQIVSLSVKNYRTLQDIALRFGSNYCTISGRNNAGKSSVIRLLSTLFQQSDRYAWEPYGNSLDFKEDQTQWVKQSDGIIIEYALRLSRADDPALIVFVEKMSTKQLSSDPTSLVVRYQVANDSTMDVVITVDQDRVESKSAKEIHKKIRDSGLLFLYNSTTPHEEYFYGRGRRRMFYDFVMSQEERKALDDAAKIVERRFRRLARDHKAGLNTILGRLSEKYDIDFSQPERYSTRRMPLGIDLKDRHVQVPLGDWGSGTQNRTRILMAVLQANRIRTSASVDERITPVLVIEEPESFLHPSAQAEFGAILRTLSLEFGLQTLVTTHSPYMLNRDEPASNILLCRDERKGKPGQTIIVDTSGEKWMAPFAEHLGIAPEEFSAWRPVFSAYKSRVLLVEGSHDREYFECFQQRDIAGVRLDKDVEVVAYGGKDTLKNTLLVKFVLSKFDHVFVTYDLDADAEVRSSLERLGLKERVDFLALGTRQPGKDAIEGLLPDRVLAAVNGRETGLVMGLRSANSGERRRAKDDLKKRYLEEFKRNEEYSMEELKELTSVVKIINARLSDATKPKARARGAKGRVKTASAKRSSLK